MTTISDIFGVKFPVVSDLKTVPDANAPDPKLVYGVELEIEHADPEWGDVRGWAATEDGSLRNSGWEYVSDPMTLSSMLHRIKRFFGNASISGDGRHYSERTSIHVHTNCTDLTLEQLSSILLLYQVTEDLLFDFVGENRAENIFCVPWSQTQITHSVVQNLKHFLSVINIDRNKYTALNLVRIRDLGTIEWRHMPGHNDQGKIETWLRLIGHYYRVARNNDFNDIKQRLLNLNTTSQYDWLLDWLFQDLAYVVRSPGYRQKLENGVLNMKYSVLQPAKFSFKRPVNTGFQLNTVNPEQYEEILRALDRSEPVSLEPVQATEGSF